MSYEGYSQNLCANGHRFDSPDLLHLEELPVCPKCNAEIVFSNSVDQTNGENAGFISDEDWRKFLYTPRETQICNLGHVHTIKEETYSIPSNEEIDLLRQRIVDWNGKVPVYSYLKQKN